MDPRAEALQFFISRGWTPEQAAGIVGNLAVESYNAKTKQHLDPNIVGDNGQAFGLAQWRGDRQRNLRDFASKNGLDYRDRQTQLAFVDYELRTPGLEKRAGDRLKAAKDVNDATGIVVKFYERAGVPHLERRLAHANEIYGAGPMTTGTAVASATPEPAKSLPAAPQAPMQAASLPQGLFSSALSGGQDQKAPLPEDQLDIFSAPQAEKAPPGPFAGPAPLSAPETPGINVDPSTGLGQATGKFQPKFGDPYKAPKEKPVRGPVRGPFQSAQQAPLASGGVKIRKS